MSLRASSFLSVSLLALLATGANAQDAAPSTPAQGSPTTLDAPADPAITEGATTPAAAPASPMADVADAPPPAPGSEPFLSGDARVPPVEVDAFMSSPETALMLTSAGWVRQSRIVKLAGSDIRAVRAMVDYARTAPSGLVSDIAAGLERAARDAERAGKPGYGQMIQEIVAQADIAPLTQAYAFAERSAGNVPQTAAIGGAGGGASGGFSGGTLTGGNLGAAGGAGGANGDDVVETRFGTYPIYSGGSLSGIDRDGGDSTRLIVVEGSTGGTDPSPAD